MGRTWAKSKKGYTPSIAERLAWADEARINSIRLFEDAASSLEAAAAEQKAVAFEAAAEAFRLNRLSDDAVEAAEKNAASAAKIRALFD